MTHAAREVEIAPSILTADFGRLAEAAAAAEAGGAALMHLDVMDGHFVPPITFGQEVVRAVRAACSLPIEAHMMVERPGEHFEALAAAGAERLIFHIEATDGVEEAGALIEQARALGAGAGVAISPETPVEALHPLLDSIDEVVVMLIRPGWGGQQMRPELLDKVRALRKHLDGAGLDVRLEVDGGVKAHNAASCVQAGADTLVAGSAVYNAEQTPGEALAALREAIGR